MDLTPLEERNREICTLYGQGKSAGWLGLHFSLSEASIRKILEAGNATRPEGVLRDPADKVISPLHQKLGLKFYFYSKGERVMNPTQVAAELGWSTQKVSAIEKGHYNITLLDLQVLVRYMRKESLSNLLENL